MPPPRDRELLFAVESLESRRLLTGIVTLDASDLDIRLTGDGNGNHVTVGTNTIGNIVVSGLFGTQIRFNGNLSTSRTVSTNVPFLIQNLDVNLRGGDDSITISEVAPDDFYVLKTTVKLGAGDDNFTGSGIEFAGSFSLNGGSGTDGALFFDSNTFGATNIQCENIGINGGFLGIRNDGAKIQTGGGDNVVYINNATVQTQLQIRTGAGDDEVTLKDSIFDGTLQINTGGGHDVVEFDDGVANPPVTIQFGGGNDLLRYLATSVFSSILTANGGGGVDSVVNIGVPSFSAGPPTYKSLNMII